MDKFKSKQGIGVAELLLLVVAIAIVVMICISTYSAKIEGEKIHEEYLKPTAGIITYMGYLQKHCMDAAEVDAVESDVDVVSVSAVTEVEQDSEPELTPDEYVIKLLGYVPEDWEWEYLYRTVKVECGYLEPDDGVMAVVYVIANRVRSADYPNTIYGVISQKNQFETWSNGAIQSCDYVEDYFIEIVDDVIAEDPHPEYRDLMSFTSGYYNPYFESAFVIGHHYFGR